MLLVLSEEQKAHLGCLPRVGGAAIGELGYLAVELLRRGAAPKACEAVASKGWGAAAPLRHPRSCGTRGG